MGLDCQPHFDVVSCDDHVPERPTAGRVTGQVVFEGNAACHWLTLGGVQGVSGQGEEEGEGGMEGGRGGGFIVGGKVGGVDGGLRQGLG